MALVKVFLCLAVALQLVNGQQPDLEKRPTRTIARFLGLERPPQPPQPPQQQQQQQYIPQQQVLSNPPPLIYNVKYYDRAGETPEVQVEQAHPQQQPIQQSIVQPFQDNRVVPSTRVFLNLYTGQQTPVYYDSKGQLYVPCPTYDHSHVHSNVNVKQVPVQVQGQKVQGQVPVPVQPPGDFVYYSQVPVPIQQQQQHQKQVQQQQQQRQVVGVGQPGTPSYVTSLPVPLPVVPDVLYYATQQQQQNPKVIGYPTSSVVAYNPYEVPYTYYPSPYGYSGYPIYPNQGGYVNPFVYVKPATVTAAPGGQGQVPVQHSQQQTDHVVVEKKNVSEKTEAQAV